MMRCRKTLIALALPLVLLSACKDEKAKATGKEAPADPHGAELKALEVGEAAPNIKMKLTDGKEVDLASLQGKQVLVYFYPKDDTPGCTVEAQGLRDGWAEIQAAGLSVYGVSMQDAASHQAFIDKYKLPFPLVVDTDGEVARAFHVPVRGTFASRQSFFIGKDGKIKHVWLEVDPKEHAATVIAAAKN